MWIELLYHASLKQIFEHKNVVLRIDIIRRNPYSEFIKLINTERKRLENISES